MAVLNDIVQGKKETLREYVERFIREGVEVQGAQDSLKCFIFENNLCDDCKFKEELGLRAARDMSDLLMSAQPYIKYKEKRMAEETLKGKQFNNRNDDKQHTENDRKKWKNQHAR